MSNKKEKHNNRKPPIPFVRKTPTRREKEIKSERKYKNKEGDY